MISLSVPNFIGNELKYVIDAVESEWVSTAGNYIQLFESEFSNYVKSSNAVACQSGTAAIHLALILAGIGQNDLVIVPTLTFIAAVNPVKYVQADPIFMDCDDTLCMDPDKLATYLADNCILENEKCIHIKSGRHIKAVIVVHVFGNLADMDKIVAICNDYFLKVIEDATEALGSYYIYGNYKGLYAGTIGDFGAFSFNGNKIITTGGGGMLISKEDSDAKKAKYLSTQAKNDDLHYVHNQVGYNYRMTNIQAALGLGQLELIENFISKKIENYNYYVKKLKAQGNYKLLSFSTHGRSNYWFYSLLVEDITKGSQPLSELRDELINSLAENKIQSRPIWGLIHQQKPYLEAEFYRIEKAYYYYDRVVNVPCSTNLKFDEIDTVLDNINKFIQGKLV